MGLFSRQYKEGKGVTKEDATRQRPFLIQFLKTFWNRLGNVIGLNILYIFVCLPIVTIGPATAALNYVLRNYSQGRPVSMFSDFFAKCKEHFKQGLIVFVINVVFAVVMFFAIYAWSSDALPVPELIKTLALIIGFFATYVCICANFYIFPMMVSFNLKTKQLIRNSIILGMYKLGRNLIMIIFTLLIVLPLVLFFPASLPFIILLPFSTIWLFNNCCVYPVFLKHIAVPEEKNENNEEDEPVFKDRH